MSEETTSMSLLVVLMADECVGGWIGGSSGRFDPVPINGERKVKLRSVERAFSAIADRLESEAIEFSQLNWIVDKDVLRSLDKPLSDYLAGTSLNDRLVWSQLLAWEAITSFYGLEIDNPWQDITVFEKGVLASFLRRNIDDTPRGNGEDVEHHKMEMASNEEAERQRLLARIRQLEQQREALRQHDLERLITYLPALYQNIFEVVSPQDLALQAGHIMPPHVPNPFPEPAPETLRRLQRDFLAMPVEIRREVVDFARALAQSERLKVRNEMRMHLDNLGV